MNLQELAKHLEQGQYRPRQLSFKNDWLGWKLAYDDALLSYHPSEDEVVRNTKEAVKGFDNYKLIFRGSGNVFCTYILAFVNEEEKPKLPYYMLNKSEISNHYEDFLNRIHVDRKKNTIVFEVEDKKYEFDQDEDFIKKYEDDVEHIFLDEDLGELIYFGYFDPEPLTVRLDAWGRRALAPSKNVPRVI